MEQLFKYSFVSWSVHFILSMYLLTKQIDIDWMSYVGSWGFNIKINSSCFKQCAARWGQEGHEERKLHMCQASYECFLFILMKSRTQPYTADTAIAIWQVIKPGFNPRLGRSPGGGHGNPFQFSCLENPRDRGAWWTVHRVAKSQTWPKQLSMHVHNNKSNEKQVKETVPI